MKHGLTRIEQARCSLDYSSRQCGFTQRRQGAKGMVDAQMPIRVSPSLVLRGFSWVHPLFSRPVHRPFPPKAVLGPCFSSGSRCDAPLTLFWLPIPPAAEGGGRDGKGANVVGYPTRRKRPYAIPLIARPAPTKIADEPFPLSLFVCVLASLRENLLFAISYSRRLTPNLGDSLPQSVAGRFPASLTGSLSLVSCPRSLVLFLPNRSQKHFRATQAVAESGDMHAAFAVSGVGAEADVLSPAVAREKLLVRQRGDLLAVDVQ